MSWRVEFSKRAERQLKKLDAGTRRGIYAWMKENVDGCGNPRAHGHGLHGKLREYWTYRIGDYRVVCEIRDGELVVLAVEVEHRSKVYR